MPNIALQVTRGATATPTTRVDHALLNQIAAPLVELVPNGDITPDFLDLDATGTALSAYLAPINWLAQPNFWHDQWEDADGRAEAAGVWTQNAATWYTKPTGAAVTVSRVESSPDTKSAYAAQLLGAASVTACDFGVFLPANIAEQLRGNTLTFSLWVKNLTDAAINIILAVQAASARNSVTDCVEFDTSANIPCANGEWTRVSFTFDATDAATFMNGALLVLRTTNLTTSLKALHVAQAQLEIGSAVTAFQPPREPSLPPEDDASYPDSATDTSASPFDMVMQNRNTGAKYYLAAPPAIFDNPQLGFNRATGRPQWVDPDGLKQVFEYTGTDQILTVPAGATSMTVHAWGGGGSNDAAASTGLVKGGVGGYSRATFTVTPATQYAVVVGEGAHGLSRAAYGFGGAGQGAAHQHNGGGLSGIFTGTTAVVAADTGRALLVAGGGGAGGQSGGGGSASQGGNGNEAAYAGGQGSMSGIAATGTQFSGNGGGGGGYAGGSGLSLGGKGGTGYVAGSGTSTSLQNATRPSLVVPGSTIDEYVSPAGQSGQHGLVVVEFA
jgi:hypothetical protein